jgi:serine phosphatase RsbU (regulator of sigma subunit)
MLQQQAAHGMQCMEIWGGSNEADAAVSTPGLDIHVLSKPYQGAEEGGDLHYVSLCGGGVTTRIIVADLCGHGAALAEQARTVRTLVRQNINRKEHTRLAQGLNKQFSATPALDRFATAAIATFLATRGRLSLTLAGHPRPLFYNSRARQWSILSDKSCKANLPLGIDPNATYSRLSVSLARGDFVVLYTDALIEARGHDQKQLGEQGLRELAERINPSEPSLFGSCLIQLVEEYGASNVDDDLTLLTIFANGNRPQRLSLGQKFDVYAKVFGIKSV